jgi:hypothetical protein
MAESGAKREKMSDHFDINQLISDRHLADLLNISEQSVQALTSEGVLEALEDAAGEIKYPLGQSIRAFVEFSQSERRELR